MGFTITAICGEKPDSENMNDYKKLRQTETSFCVNITRVRLVVALVVVTCSCNTQ